MGAEHEIEGVQLSKRIAFGAGGAPALLLQNGGDCHLSAPRLTVPAPWPCTLTQWKPERRHRRQWRCTFGSVLVDGPGPWFGSNAHRIRPIWSEMLVSTQRGRRVEAKRQMTSARLQFQDSGSNLNRYSPLQTSTPRAHNPF